MLPFSVDETVNAVDDDVVVHTNSCAIERKLFSSFPISSGAMDAPSVSET